MPVLSQILQLQPRLEPRLRLSLELRRSVQILEQSRTRLNEWVEKEAAQNPFLQWVGGRPRVSALALSEESDFDHEDWLAKAPSLVGHLRQQLALLALSDKETEIADEIIGNLDANGYLTQPLTAIAVACGVKLPEVENILKKVQCFDPPGIAARDLKECLLLQMGSERSFERLIVEQHLTDVSARRWDKIAKSLSVSPEEVSEAISKIKQLEPKPARNFEISGAVTRIPDVVVRRKGRRFEIKTTDEIESKLKINPDYERLLKDPETPPETQKFLKEKLDAAVALLKAIHERQLTLEKLARCLVEHQNNFFFKGPTFLKSFRFQDAAKIL